MADTIPGDASSVQALEVNSKGDSAIDALGDHDWWRVSLAAGQTYQFDLLGWADDGSASGLTLADPYLRLRSSAGALEAEDDDLGVGLNSRITYTATETGTYFLDAAAFGDGTGSYRLIVNQSPLAGAIGLGSTVNDNLDFAGDVDLYSVSLTAGIEYFIWLDGTTLADPYLEVLNSAGGTLAGNDNSGDPFTGPLNPRLNFTPSDTGTYFLSARESGNDSTGGYSLHIIELDIPDDTSSTRTLVVDGIGDSAIDSLGDDDWWRVSLIAGQTYQFDLIGSADDGAGSGLTLDDPWLNLFSDIGVHLVGDNDSGVGLNARITFTPAVTGTYFLSAEEAGQDNTGSYRIIANRSPVVGAIGPSSPVGDSLDFTGDVDQYSISLTGGSTYRIALEGETLADPYLELLDGDGATIAQADNGGSGLNSLLEFTPTISGTYVAAARESGNDALGTYWVSIVEDSIPGNLSSTRTLLTNGAGDSTIDWTGDHDWWRVSLVAGQMYRFDLLGSAHDGGVSGLTLGDPYLSLLSGTGSQLLSDDDSGVGLNSRITFTPAISGTYFLDASQLGDNSTGSYRLIVNQSPQVGAIALGTPVSGSLVFPGDIDQYSVSMTAGITYRITLTGTTLADPYVEVLDGNGVTVAQADNGGLGLNSLLDFTPTVSGSFFLVARESGNDSIGGYLLTVQVLDATPPEVITFSPADGATGVAVGSNVVLSFSETVQRGTGAILLKTEAGSVIESYDAVSSANLSIGGSTLTVNPTAGLLNGTRYFLEFPSGAIVDLAGNPYAGTSSYDFTTIAAADITPPTVVSFDPADEATGVLVSTHLVLAFSEAVQRGTGNVVLRTAAGSVVEIFSAASSANISISGNLLTLNPTADLAPGTRYFVDFPSGSLRDLAGNAYGGTSSYDFTTAEVVDISPPVATGFVPADGATGVAVGANVGVTFNEAIQRGNGSIILRTAAGLVVETIDAASSSRLTISGNNLTLDPSASLLPEVQYFVEFPAGSVKDLAGNTYAGTTSYDFTTAATVDAIPPLVIGFVPADGATSVAVDTNVGVTFDEAIQGGNGLIVLRTAAGLAVETFDAASSSRLVISGDTLTLDPSANLLHGVQYVVEFPAGSVRDLAGNAYAGTSSYDFTTAPAIDSTPPSVLSYSPADGATGVAVGTNIVLTFDEAIQRGTGSILLKTAAGVVVEAYLAASSAGLSISGSTLTIDPASDLSFGTPFVVELPVGSVRDLSDNPYAGTSSYQFTTRPVPGRSDNFVAAQSASPAILGSGPGDDTYLLSPSLLPSGISLTLVDTQGSNSIQIAPGLDLASSRVAETALQLSLTNGSVITVLGANQFSYEPSGNASAGLDGGDLGYGQFVQQTLGVALPSGSGVVSGGAVVVGGGTPMSAFPAGSAADNFLVAEYASPAILGSGPGDDTYLLSAGLLPAGVRITIADAIGVDSIQLAAGLRIAASRVARNALLLTLENGSIVTILSAESFGYEAGGNRSAGMDGADLSYAQFAQQILGVPIPADQTIANGGPVVIVAAEPSGTIGLTAGSTAPVSGTSGADVFVFDVSAARAITANTQIDIHDFSTHSDRLRLDLPLASGVGSLLAALNGQQDVVVQFSPFVNATLITFGADADGTLIAIRLLGVADPALVQVEVV